MEKISNLELDLDYNRENIEYKNLDLDYKEIWNMELVYWRKYGMFYLFSVDDMNLAKPPVITEEPVPGWLRYEVEGEKPWFKTPVPRTVIRDAIKLQDFLEKEHSNERMLEVDGKSIFICF